MKSLFVCFALLAIALSPRPTRADAGGPVDIYGDALVDVFQVTGQLTITGTNACTPTCAETLDFSFLIGSDYNPTGATPYNLYVIPNSGTVESFGPLSQFSLVTGGFLSGSDGGECGAGGDCNRITFLNPDGDEIDLHTQWASGSSPITPNINAADLFACGSGNYVTCGQDFAPNQPYLAFNFGEVTTTVTPAPEPSSFFMLGAGLCALGLLVSSRRRYC